jgi:hypothetical protein
LQAGCSSVWRASTRGAFQVAAAQLDMRENAHGERRGSPVPGALSKLDRFLGRRRGGVQMSEVCFDVPEPSEGRRAGSRRQLLRE